MAYPVQNIVPLIDFCWTVFLIYWLFKAFGNKKEIYKRQYLGLRILVLILAFLAAMLIAKHYRDSVILPYSAVTQIAGVLICAFGVGWAIWARAILGTNWSARPTVKENHELIQSGPYAITRHPIYTGVITALLGTFLAVIPTWFGLGFLAMALVGFYFKIRLEERLMTQTFPEDYPAYKQRVPAGLIPYIF